SFTRNNGAEQIDGAFRLDGWTYLVECRWRDKLADIREPDGLKGQVDRSGKQALGLFIGMNGWSDNVVPLLKQNPGKAIILMEGYDLRTVLSEKLDLRDFLLKKADWLTRRSEPFLSVRAYLQR
ncbi:MAG: restriction endonuclease, partial [Candidatus Xenobia bacterium]